MTFDVEFWSNFFKKFQVALKVWLLTSAGNVLFWQTRQHTDFLKLSYFWAFLLFPWTKDTLIYSVHCTVCPKKFSDFNFKKYKHLLFISDTKNVLQDSHQIKQLHSVPNLWWEWFFERLDHVCLTNHSKSKFKSRYVEFIQSVIDIFSPFDWKTGD